MRKISTTRAELLAHKAQLKLARQGRDLLEQKRTVLMKEFMRVVNSVMAHSNVLQQTAVKASHALARAESIAGVEEVRSVSLAARSTLPLNIKTLNMMGVKIPHIEQRAVRRSMLGRGYAVSGASVAIDEAASAFEDEIESILQLSESELRLTRLSQEIQRTSRRLNALDHYLIPQLESEEKFIQMALDERERSDHFRLKLIKRALSEKQTREK